MWFKSHQNSTILSVHIFINPHWWDQSGTVESRLGTTNFSEAFHGNFIYFLTVFRESRKKYFYVFHFVRGNLDWGLIRGVTLRFQKIFLKILFILSFFHRNVGRKSWKKYFYVFRLVGGNLGWGLSCGLTSNKSKRCLQHHCEVCIKDN